MYKPLKMQHICNYCKLSFISNNTKRKFCSRKCYQNSPKRSLTVEEKEAISKRVKKEYENKDAQINRWINIGLGKTKFFTDEEFKRIEEVYNYKYIINDEEVLYRANIKDKSKKILQNYKQRNKEWYKNLGLYRNMPLYIQKWSYEKFYKFIEDSKVINYIDFIDKYKLSEKVVHRLIKIGVLSDNLLFKNRHISWRSKETRIESFVKEFLIKNNISYTKEYFIKSENNKRYFYDFLISNNKIIEVNGDYWHTNPKVYTSNCTLTDVQKRNIINDINKEKLLKELEYQLLIVWEYDIYKTPNEVKETILKYAKS